MNDDWLPMPRYRLRKDLVKTILRQEDLGNKTCLELGYGSGDMLLTYAELGLRVYGFDISEQAFRYANHRLENHPFARKMITLLKNQSDIHQRQFDYIMAFEVLEHIEDDISCLREWSGILKEKGKLLISVPAHMSKWGTNDIATGHYRRYEKESFISLLQGSGFRVLHFWNYAYPLSILLDIFLHGKKRGRPENGLSKEELTKLSGIDKEKSLVNRLVSSDFFLTPFFLIQRFFLNRDLSSAYLAFTEKMPKIVK